MASTHSRIITVELEAFAQRYGLSVKTVINRCSSEGIPGIRLMGNKYMVEEGTRYPIDKRKIKASYDTPRKRLELLRAIKDDRFIDEYILKVEKLDFDSYITDYLNAGFIEKRHCQNQYGANNYRTTPLGNKVFVEEKIKQQLHAIEMAGIFTGEVVSRIIRK